MKRGPTFDSSERSTESEEVARVSLLIVFDGRVGLGRHGFGGLSSSKFFVVLVVGFLVILQERRNKKKKR